MKTLFSEISELKEIIRIEKITAFCLPFSIGTLTDYFNGDPDEQFWRTNAADVAHASLYSIIRAQPFGEEDMADMKERAFRNNVII